MNIIFSDQPQIIVGKSLFLAGPTTRAKDVESWRTNAVNILKYLKYDGTVLVPERADWQALNSYEEQIEWEYSGLLKATNIVFWVPRSDVLPGFTTNVEFGYWLNKTPEKIVYGRPDDSKQTRYLDFLYFKETCQKPFNDLTDMLSIFKDYVK